MVKIYRGKGTCLIFLVPFFVHLSVKIELPVKTPFSISTCITSECVDTSHSSGRLLRNVLFDGSHGVVCPALIKDINTKNVSTTIPVSS